MGVRSIAERRGLRFPDIYALRVLQECRRRVRKGGPLFVSARVPGDWRWGRGTEEEPGGFRLDWRETGEYGLLNVFYNPDELCTLIRTDFGELHDSQRLSISYDSPQGGLVIRNAEVVLWGRLGKI